MTYFAYAEQIAREMRFDACGRDPELFLKLELARVDAVMAPAKEAARKRRMARLTDEREVGRAA